jgi:hypothetical protein
LETDLETVSDLVTSETLGLLELFQVIRVLGLLKGLRPRAQTRAAAFGRP